MYPNDDRQQRHPPVRPPDASDPLAAERPVAAARPEDVPVAESATGYRTGGTYPQPAATAPTTDANARTSSVPPTTGANVGPPDARARLGSQAAYRTDAPGERTLELREEQLVAHKDLRQAGEITVRTVVEEVPGRLEVEAQREEVEIEHCPVGQIVNERVGPYEENGVLVVPVYEEQLVVVKRLVLKEHLRVRRVASTEHQVFEDKLRRDRLVIEDPNNTHFVHEQYGNVGDKPGDRAVPAGGREREEHDDGGLLGHLVRKALG
ncbi:MAG TPA: DUF2382 domain-containing protein [Chloroflexota bacterium]|nr:DUF2382 domain-containing protein [Chloroflexota bacterium]